MQYERRSCVDIKEFDTIFEVKKDSSVQTKSTIRVSAITIRKGAILKPGQIIAGVDFSKFIGRKFQVQNEEDRLIIRGIFS